MARPTKPGEGEVTIMREQYFCFSSFLVSCVAVLLLAICHIVAFVGCTQDVK